MSIIDKIKKSKQSTGPDLLAKQFFTDNNTNGYVSKEEFLFHLSNIENRSVLELEAFFQYLKDGKRLDSLLIPRKDRADNDYVWCNIQLPKGSPGVKILIFGEVLQFIKDYQEGAFTVPFTLTDLYDEAEQKSEIIA